jgi:CubicO group peptidase (beta-lactamase class C family)
MAEVKVDIDPEEVGFDRARLARIDQHLARYVDDGRLAGWLLGVARHGHLAHLSSHGRRDLESGAAVEADTIWRLFSMTKPITSVAAMMLYEEGAFELKDPVARCGSGPAAPHKCQPPCPPSSRSGCGTSSPTPRA